MASAFDRHVIHCYNQFVSLEAVEHGAAPGRQPVADVEALGQAEALQLAHIDLERLRLPAQRRGQVGGPDGRPRGDQAQDRLGPGTVAAGPIEPRQPGADARQLVVGNVGVLA